MWFDQIKIFLLAFSFQNQTNACYIIFLCAHVGKSLRKAFLHRQCIFWFSRLLQVYCMQRKLFCTISKHCGNAIYELCSFYTNNTSYGITIFSSMRLSHIWLQMSNWMKLKRVLSILIRNFGLKSMKNKWESFLIDDQWRFLSSWLLILKVWSVDDFLRRFKIFSKFT